MADTSAPAKPSLTVFGFVAVLLRRYRLVLALPTLVAGAVAVVSLLLPVRYRATAQFRPEAPTTNALPSGIALLAGQFGVNIGGGQAESSQFYADLLSTRRLLERLLTSRFPAEDGDSVVLLSRLDITGIAPGELMENAVNHVRQRMEVSVDPRTQVVAVNFEMPTAELAADVSNRAVDLLNEYNRTTRQSQAREKRKFAEERVAETAAVLRGAEDSLRAFYEANRQLTSPRLQFEEARLQRGVNLRQTLLQSLSEELETAKIAEVNDVPALTLVDPAVPPTRKAWPRRTLSVLAAWVLTFLAVVAWVSVSAYRSYFVDGDPEGVAALRASWRRVAGPVGTPPG